MIVYYIKMQKQQLFTSHDKYHIHKSLGFLCLFHYFIRLYWLLIYGTMFLNCNSYFTFFTPILHLSLSVSSFVFHVPKIRYDSKIIIWKELQLHNIVFTSRSATLMIYWILCKVYNNEHYILHNIIRLFIVILHHYIADIITNKYNFEYKTTTRDINWENIPDNVKKYIKKYYAICQILALNAIILCECDISGKGFMESCFIIMFPIQLSAFLMTLVRKSIISNIYWHIFYGLSLSTPFLISINNKSFVSNNSIKLYLPIIYIILRLYFKINKFYLMFFVVYSYLYYTFTKDINNYFISYKYF